ncbi:MAG: flagellar hook-length control protein FliK [Acidimicrobiales bacterium]
MSGNGHLPQINHITPAKQSSAADINARRQADIGRSPAADRFDQILRDAQRPDRSEPSDRQITDSQARAADRRRIQSRRDDLPGPSVDRDRPRTELDKPERRADADKTDRSEDSKPVESTDRRPTDDDSGTDAATDNDAADESVEGQQQDDGEAVDNSETTERTGDATPVELQPLPAEASVEEVQLEDVVEVEETVVDAEQALDTNLEIPVDVAAVPVEEAAAVTVEVAEVAEVTETENMSEGEEEAPQEEAPADETAELTNPLAAAAAVQATVPVESSDGAGPVEEVDEAAPLAAVETSSGEASADASPGDNQADIDIAADVDLVEAETAEPTGEVAQATDSTAGEEASVPVPVTTSPTVSSTASAAAATTTSAIGQVSTTEGIEPAIDASQLAPAAEAEDGDQLWHQVRRAIGSLRTTTTGDQQMTIRLSPAELGSVVVRVSTGESGTAVTLVTESAAAANQLNQQRQQLISDLEETGIGGVDVDIDTSADTNQSENEDAEDGDDRNGSGRSALGGSAVAESDLVRNYGNRRDRAATSRLVDVDL